MSPLAILYWVLVICGLVCFLLASFGVPLKRVSLVPLGLFFWLMSTLIHTHGHLR